MQVPARPPAAHPAHRPEVGGIPIEKVQTRGHSSSLTRSRCRNQQGVQFYKSRLGAPDTGTRGHGTSQSARLALTGGPEGAHRLSLQPRCRSGPSSYPCAYFQVVSAAAKAGAHSAWSPNIPWEVPASRPVLAPSGATPEHMSCYEKLQQLLAGSHLL